MFLLRMCAPHMIVVVPSDHYMVPEVNAYNLPVAEEN